MPIDFATKNSLDAAQIFGYAGNLFSQAQQQNSLRSGTKADQAALQNRLQQETVQATQQSIESSENLAEVLASQRAIFAARGQAAGQGTARQLGNKSLNAYTREESNRLLALNYSQQQAKAQGSLLKVREYNSLATQYAQNAEKLFQNTSLNNIFSNKVDDKYKLNYKSKNGYGL